MKKLLLTALLGLPILTMAQTFQQLEVDGIGDDYNFRMDITELAYTFSNNDDSLYVKITHHNKRGKDFGFALAIDTNLNPNDGSTINQTNMVGNANVSMKADLLLLAYQNGTFPTVYTEPASVNFQLDTADAYYSIFRIPLNELGGNVDFNIIGFTGGFDISSSGPSDAIPNSTFAQIRKNQVGMDENKLEVGIFPNPASDFFYLEQSGWVSIFNTEGKVVKSLEAIAGKPVDCSDLTSGLYYIIYGNTAEKLLIH